jgi:hypothetical protein
MAAQASFELSFPTAASHVAGIVGKYHCAQFTKFAAGFFLSVPAVSTPNNKLLDFVWLVSATSALHVSRNVINLQVVFFHCHWVLGISYFQISTPTWKIEVFFFFKSLWRYFLELDSYWDK